MNVPAVAAAVFLLFVIAPAPLVWLDSMYHRWLVRRIVNASGGRVDSDTASDRLRFAEWLEPKQSAVLFASIGLVAAAASRVAGANFSAVKAALVMVLALAAAGLGLVQDRYSWGRAGAFAAGATSVVAML